MVNGVCLAYYTFNGIKATSVFLHFFPLYSWCTESVSLNRRIVVLGWLVGNPWCFKAFVGNRVSEINWFLSSQQIETCPINQEFCGLRIPRINAIWTLPLPTGGMVEGEGNRLACNRSHLHSSRRDETSFHGWHARSHSPRQVFDLQQDSSHSILGATFMDKCHLRRESKAVNNQPYLSSPELAKADCRLMLFMQFQHFKDEISALTCRKEVVWQLSCHSLRSMGSCELEVVWTLQ